ncbi:DUF3558 domain-containing protein [Streptomyces sp. NBC_00193]|uniref:DUF3558 domain-containing protein n=1 Tax=unclassified Streptomyces TaxID=2593676 RepID=UPI002258959A|nr:MULTISPECIES: DUF3558 domain-containing protein [unclassified Streptomyces]MCX5123341.1 DUF3558 domain-containing protein [Streptomyces sp. NBC_00347]MCX5296687.1 DUF3558 domain-containing protein [Streptomyces sp. NBC_00193]
MQRKTVRVRGVRRVRGVLPAIAMLTALAAGLTACTDGGGSGTKIDAKAGANAGTGAQPGKYRSLPMPCKAADAKKVKAMLPAPDTLAPEAREALYAGVADASYDADRRVGCRWTAQTPTETRLLSVGFERVVSYDRATTSDDDKARQVYGRQLTAANLPAPAPSASPTPSGSGAPTPGAPTPGAPAASTGASTDPGASGSPSPAPELGSRVLEGLGNEAFLDDKLAAAGASAAQARTVRIVFRTSNVIVTVEYSVQPALPGTIPPSGETQDRARQLAQALVERFNE